MDTGFFRTADGQPIPAFFIKDVVVTYGDAQVARFDWTSGVSKDPIVSFTLRADREAPLTMIVDRQQGCRLQAVRQHRLRRRVDPVRCRRRAPPAAP